MPKLLQTCPLRRATGDDNRNQWFPATDLASLFGISGIPNRLGFSLIPIHTEFKKAHYVHQRVGGDQNGMTLMHLLKHFIPIQVWTKRRMDVHAWDLHVSALHALEPAQWSHGSHALDAPKETSRFFEEPSIFFPSPLMCNTYIIFSARFPFIELTMTQSSSTKPAMSLKLWVFVMLYCTNNVSSL